MMLLILCVNDMRKNWSFFDRMGAACPGFGMIGTLVGLINMLCKPWGKCRKGTWCWNVSCSCYYILWLYCSAFDASPIANRLKAIHAEELFMYADCWRGRHWQLFLELTTIHTRNSLSLCFQENPKKEKSRNEKSKKETNKKRKSY
jgi:hypothetical protein